MFINILILVLALAAVIKGADWFLGAVEKVGSALGLPQFVMGVVLVGFGTSLPELATSLSAIFGGVDTVTIPNVTGSNIANVLLVLGISTIVYGTITFKKDLVDLDLTLLFGSSALFILMIVDGTLSRGEGVILLFGFVSYILYSISYTEDSEHHKGLISYVSALLKPKVKTKIHKSGSITPFTIMVLIGSIVLLSLGSKFAVDSLLAIVEKANIEIGVLTFFALAIGTSLPELVVSLKALKKGQGELVVGNIIGSCMFNILLIGGIASVLSPQQIDTGLIGYVLGGLGLSALMLLLVSIGKRIHIWEGFIFVLIYLTLATKII